MEDTMVEHAQDGKRWEVTATEFWDAVRERARAGKHTVVLSPGPLPAAPRDLHVLLVDCVAPDAPPGWKKP